MQAYVAAKAHILDFQTAADIAVLNCQDAATWALSERTNGRLWAFGCDELPAGQLGAFVRGDAVWLRDEKGEHAVLPVADIALIGEHNQFNVVAAVTIAAAVGAPVEAIRSGVRGFRGAPHRLEWVRSLNGIDWYNDSIATAPQRAEAALRSFERPVVLMLGGRDKGLPWEGLAQLAAQKARHVVLFGEAAPMLADVFKKAAPKLENTQATDLAGAVQAAAAAAKPGNLVLLSPGGTSFDEFVDFEERGERFCQMVNEL
jgi:UDP-N-acetylmuramoylalanine--D-glutamate ligase